MPDEHDRECVRPWEAFVQYKIIDFLKDEFTTTGMLLATMVPRVL